MRPIKAAAGSNAVEAAIAEGKILPSRRAHYLALMAKKPERTLKVLAGLEPVLTGDYQPENLDGSPRAAGDPPVRLQAAAPVRPAVTGGESYPKDWLRAAEVVGKAAGSVTFEDALAGAGAMAPVVR